MRGGRGCPVPGTAVSSRFQKALQQTRGLSELSQSGESLAAEPMRGVDVTLREQA